jgi:glycerol kinase
VTYCELKLNQTALVYLHVSLGTNQFEPLYVPYKLETFIPRQNYRTECAKIFFDSSSRISHNEKIKSAIETATQNLILLDINPADIVAIAITNQRETTILWNNLTGLPLHNAIGKNIFQV